MNFLVLFRFFFGFVFFENGAAREGIGVCFRGGLFVLGFREIGGQRGNLVFAKLSLVMNGSGFLLDGCLRRFGHFSGLSGRRFGFSAGVGQ